MNKAFISFSLLFLFKVVSGEWVFGVQVQEFENIYSYEIRNHQFCCCDIAPTADTVSCAENITDLDSALCSVECKPYLETSLEVCFSNLTCFIIQNDNVLLDSIFATCIGPPLVQFHSQETTFENISSITLSVTAWEDDPEVDGDDLMDQFMILLPASVSEENQIHILNVEGQYGVGNLTLTYFNLSTDPVTSCSSVAPLTITATITPPTETVTTTINITSVVVMTSCPSDMTTSSAMTESTVSSADSTNISVPSSSMPGSSASSDVMTSISVSSIALPGSTSTVEETSVDSMWRILAIALIVLAALLAFTSIALVFMICRMKNGVKARNKSRNSTGEEEVELPETGTGESENKPLHEPSTTSDEVDEDRQQHVYSVVHSSKPAAAKDDVEKSDNLDEEFGHHVYSTVNKDSKSPPGSSDQCAPDAGTN